MSDFNIGSEFKTLVDKGSVHKNEYVKVSKNGDWETFCTIKTDDGREEVYKKEELMNFGIAEKANIVFDIVGDYYKSQDEFGNKDVLHGLLHLTKNVRSGKHTFRFWEDCRYSSPGYGNSQSYRYQFKELSDKEVVDILLNDILYDYSPDLSSISCVGTSLKGIDKDPNYHDGVYVLCNDKEYTMTHCYGKVFIREGRDSGWYHNPETCGRTLYEGKIDWERYKKAKIKQAAKYMLKRGHRLLDEFPEICEILCNSLKEDDRFKLNYEFED